jgi:NitT/TauT family transport system permease protein
MRSLFTPGGRGHKALPFVLGSIFLLGWHLLRPAVLPGPIETLQAFPTLVSEGIWTELLSSLFTNVEAICVSTVLGLSFAYLSPIPVMTLCAESVGKLRFVGSAVFYLPLLLVISDSHWIKVWLLSLGMVYSLVTGLTDVVRNIPEYRYDDAKTLRMGPWTSLWYVVIRGTLPDVFDAVRANAAFGWSMLLFVEGVVRSEGGLGVTILNAEKHVNYDDFFAVIILILGIGVGQDWLFKQAKKVVCPYA